MRFSHSEPEDCRDTLAGQVDDLLSTVSTASNHANYFKTFEVHFEVIDNL